MLALCIICKISCSPASIVPLKDERGAGLFIAGSGSGVSGGAIGREERRNRYSPSEKCILLGLGLGDKSYPLRAGVVAGWL